MKLQKKHYFVMILLFFIISGGFLLRYLFLRQIYQYDVEKGNQSSINFQKNLIKNHRYQIEIFITDSDQSFARVDANFSIYFDNILNESFRLHNSGVSYTDDDVAVASDQKIIQITPTKDIILKIIGLFKDGDNWQIYIYQDLPKNTNNQYWTWLVLTLISGFIAVDLGKNIFRKSK